VSLQCAAAQTGKDSFFLANDPKLLDIMERQGLQFALHTIPVMLWEVLWQCIVLLLLGSVVAGFEVLRCTVVMCDT
jgi:hypothetical protein